MVSEGLNGRTSSPRPTITLAVPSTSPSSSPSSPPAPLATPHLRFPMYQGDTGRSIRAWIYLSLRYVYPARSLNWCRVNMCSCTRYTTRAHSHDLSTPSAYTKIRTYVHTCAIASRCDGVGHTILTTYTNV